jgi:hypothetical protein
MSNAQPFYLKSRNCWCIHVYVDGVRVRRKLADTKTEAFDIWKASLRARRETAVRNPRFLPVASKCLSRQVQRFDDNEVSSDRLEQSLARSKHLMPPTSPYMLPGRADPVLYEWLRGRSANYRRTEYSCIRQCLSWAFAKKLIAEDPLLAIACIGSPRS